jgi:hypothetical protein
MITLEFVAADDESSKFFGRGPNFLEAAIELLKALTVFVDVDDELYDALAALRRGDGEYVSVDFGDPEAGFTMRRTDTE